MKSLFLAALVAAMLLLAGCSLLPAQYSALEDGAAQIAVQSSERAICRDLPVGAWIKLYGASVSRLQGWQDLCFNPIVTPLNEETVAALLKAYPGFANNPPTAPQAPASTNIPTQNLGPANAVQAPATLTPGTPLFPAKKASKAKPAPAPGAVAPALAPSVTSAPVATPTSQPSLPALPGGLPGQ
jgi:hypothetical protein